MVGEYLATLSGRSASTVKAYGRILRLLAGLVFDATNQSVAEYMTRDLEDFAKANLVSVTYHTYRLQIREHPLHPRSLALRLGEGT